MDTEIKHPMTFEMLQQLLPDAHVEPTCSGELVIYTGWRQDERTNEDDAPLIPFECPSCNCEDQGDNPHDCTDAWHLEPFGRDS